MNQKLKIDTPLRPLRSNWKDQPVGKLPKVGLSVSKLQNSRVVQTAKERAKAERKRREAVFARLRALRDSDTLSPV